MKKGLAFLIYPYLKTSRRVEVCGLELRPIEDVDGLSEEEAQILGEVRPLFFLADHQVINDMAYAVVDPENATLRRQMEKSQALLAYVYSQLDFEGEPFFGAEQTTNFLILQNPRASQFSVMSEHLTTNLWPEESWPKFNEHYSALGYTVYQNGHWWGETFAGGRIYPPGRVGLNHSQDLCPDLHQFGHARQNWALSEFFKFETDLEDAFEDRVLNSLRWYRRSISVAADPEVSLLHLAIALESLLNLEAGDKITDRFVETVGVLLGATERLEVWALQFYDARSKIVHRGWWPDLHFYPHDKQALRKKGNSEAPRHRPLREFGLVVYRLCFTAILSGALMAKQSKLRSSFVPNNERLLNIMKAVNAEGVEPLKALRQVAQDVYDLDDYYFRQSQREVDFGLLVALVKAMSKLSLQTSLDSSESVTSAADAVVRDDSGGMAAYGLIQALDKELQGWKKAKYDFEIAEERGKVDLMRKDPVLVLEALVRFACSPGVKLQVHLATRKTDESP